MSILHDPVASLTIYITLALLLSSAGVQKLRQRDGFAMVLIAYGILPAAVITQACWLVPLSEVGLAIGLLAPATRQAAALLTAILLLTYGAAMAFTLMQGRHVSDCGCSAGRARQRVSVALVWRNVALALVALNAMPSMTMRNLGIYDWTAIALATLIGSALYTLANTLIATQQVSRELRHV